MEKDRITETQKGYIRRAIELALKGRGFTDPNPVVGAVVVKNGRVIGEGYHERYGQLHAERNALKNCTETRRGPIYMLASSPAAITARLHRARMRSSREGSKECSSDRTTRTRRSQERVKAS